jgi:hypothetical protein
MRTDCCATAALVIAFSAAPSPAWREPERSPQTTQPAAPTDRATAADVMGKAERRIGKNPDRWAPIKTGDLVAADSAVQTAEDSALLLSLPDGHVVRIGESTTLEIKAIGQNKSFSFGLVKGRIWSFVDKAKKPTKYEIETPSVILGVSGTVFSAARDEVENEMDVSVENGEVRLRRGWIEKVVGPGQQTRVLNGRLGFAFVRKQTKATQEMWKTVGSAESWMRPHGALRLNKQVEAGARALRQERQKERAGAGRGAGRGRRGGPSGPGEG